VIVSCGEALVDLVPDPVPGGGPMNAAIAAARLGAPAAFVGRVSTDHYGDTIWEHLQRNSVDLRAAQRGPEPTALAIIEHTPKLQFRFEGDGTADSALEPVDLGALGGGPHIIHGGTLGLFRGRTAEVLAGLVETHTGIVSLDPNVRPAIITDRAGWDRYFERWLARAHLVRASDEDLDWIWPGEDDETIAERLLGGPAKAVIVTRGAEGAVLHCRNGTARVPGRAVEVVDTVGAGDTFIGTTLVGLWERGLAGEPDAIDDLSLADWTAILDLAVAAAAITCSRPGADPPTRAELAAA
jgi:fructokinase